MSVLMYTNERMVVRQKYQGFGLLGVGGIERIPNTRIRELCGVMEGLIKTFFSGLGVKE